MPVSHLGLSVSHIPSATSFYLAALQPLGYHYIGHQGGSVGLGVDDADLFLSQERKGRPVSPTHVAFAANDRLTVRNCYAAALNAGGQPSGAPGYRNNDCSCFNAAVFDFDGNTVEFIYREPISGTDQEGACVAIGHGRSSTGYENEGSKAKSTNEQPSSPKPSSNRSRYNTALDLASSTSKSIRSPKDPSPGISRSRTEPVTSSNAGKAITGTLLGAAAGATFAYAMYSLERESARDEAQFSSSWQPKHSSARDGRRMSAYELPEVPRADTSYKGSTYVRPRRSHSTRESIQSTRYPPRSLPRIMPRAIAALPYYEHDDERGHDSVSHHTGSSRRTSSHTRANAETDYGQTELDHGRERTSRVSVRRVNTLPAESGDLFQDRYRDTAPSRGSTRRSSVNDSQLQRHDSSMSVHSVRTYRQSEAGRRSSASQASTVKPARPNTLLEYPIDVPSRSSKAPSYVTAADVPIPPSEATSYTVVQEPDIASKAQSYVSAAQIAMPPSRTGDFVDDAEEESDGLGDMRTVVPDDSISCIDLSKPKRASPGSSGHKGRSSARSYVSDKRSSRHTGGQSEQDRGERRVWEPKPRGRNRESDSRHSALTIPLRSKSATHRDGHRAGGSRSSYA